MFSIYRAVARTSLIGGCIFIYSGYARLTSFEFNFISKETSRTEPEYMNIHPPPPPINVLSTALSIYCVLRLVNHLPTPKRIYWLLTQPKLLLRYTVFPELTSMIGLRKVGRRELQRHQPSAWHSADLVEQIREFFWQPSFPTKKLSVTFRVTQATSHLDKVTFPKKNKNTPARMIDLDDVPWRGFCAQWYLL